MTRALVFWLAVLMLFLGGTVIFAAWKLTRGTQPGGEIVADGGDTTSLPDTSVKPPGADKKWIDEFTLTERSGESFGTDDLEGKVWVGSFFFANCQGSCRKQNMTLMTLQNEFGPEGVKFVSITCDPDNDTPTRLSEYAEGFSAHPDQWYFLTGDLNYITRVGGEYFQLAVQKSGHQDRFAVVDKWGNVRARYNWTDPIQLDALRKLLPKLLAEEVEPAEYVEAKKERARQLEQVEMIDQG